MCCEFFMDLLCTKIGSTRWLEVIFWKPPGMELVKWWSVMRRVVQRLAAVTNVFAPWKTDMKMKEARALLLLNDNAPQMRLPWLRVGFLKGVQGLRWDATLYSIAQFCEKHCFHRVSEHQGEPGHCAYRGSCLEEAKFNKAEHLCQHNTFVSCRVWGCPSTLGETKCDGFLSGLGTYNCLCEDEKENGNCWNECQNMLDDMLWSPLRFTLVFTFTCCFLYWGESTIQPPPRRMVIATILRRLLASRKMINHRLRRSNLGLTIFLESSAGHWWKAWDL